MLPPILTARYSHRPATSLAALLCLALGGCLHRPPPAPPAQAAARYLHRQVELRPFYPDPAFTPLAFDRRSGQIFYWAEGSEGKTLWRIGEDKRADLGQGAAINSDDFSRRIFLQPQYSPAWGGLIARSGGEPSSINLWFFPERGGRARRLTEAEQVHAFALNAAGDRLFYLARYGSGVAAEGCLEQLAFGSGRPQRLFCDRDLPDKIGPGWLGVSPSGEQLAFSMRRAGRQRLFLFDRIKGRRLAVPLSFRPRGLIPFSLWQNEQAVHFIAEGQTGPALYRYRLGQRQVRRIDPSGGEIRGAAILRQGKREVLAALQANGFDTTLWLLDPFDGRPLFRRDFDGRLTLYSAEGEELILQQETARQPFRYWLARLDKGQALLSFSLYLDPPAEQARAAQLCQVQRVEFPSPQADPQTGRPWTIRALLYTPNQPLAEARQRLFLIEAFHGGDNRYRRTLQIDCGLGISTLSPALRGSERFGREWAAANHGARADAPVRDLAAAARFLERRFKLQPWQIGLFGQEQGAWAVLRALTVPTAADRYPYGFGVALSGVYDLLAVFDQPHPPDWVEREIGSPDRHRQRLENLSPLPRADRVAAPLLLLEIAEEPQSERLQSALEKAGKESQLVRLPAASGTAAEWAAMQAKHHFFNSLTLRPH